MEGTFVGPDPFASPVPSHSGGDRPLQQQESGKGSRHAVDHEKRRESRPIEQERTSRESKHVDQGTTLEKVRLATDDGQGGLVDRVRSTAHRFHVDHLHTWRVSRFLNPTTIRYKIRYGSNDSHAPTSSEEYLWRARDNRKGRNSVAPSHMQAYDGERDGRESPFVLLGYTPRLSGNIGAIAATLRRMCTTFPYWDMAFWSGATYTIGSALFVADGVLAWGPVAFGAEKFESLAVEIFAGPVCFFIGAIFYQIGAVAAYLEAVNDGSFHGSAVRRLLLRHFKEEQQQEEGEEKMVSFFTHVKPQCPHRKPNLLSNSLGHADAEAAAAAGSHEEDLSTSPRGYDTWRWWPTWRRLRTHHLYDLGYIACTIQLCGVTLYGITAVVILPGILSSLSPGQKLAAFWIPQVVAALCFLTASLMFALETQEKWWKPEFRVLGWWIGFWSTTGSVGFELIACFGIYALVTRRGGDESSSWSSRAQYQSDLATVWGSACYFLGSFLQWYEAMNKDPMKELLGRAERGRNDGRILHSV